LSTTATIYSNTVSPNIVELYSTFVYDLSLTGFTLGSEDPLVDGNGSGL